MDAIEAQTIGRRVRQIRKSRRKPLAVVAGLAGMSKSALDRIERGEVALDRISQIIPLAAALQISPSDLMQLPVPAPVNGHTDSAIEAVRCALEAADQGMPEGLVLPIGVLTARVDELYEMRRLCQTRQAGTALPGLIRDLHASALAGQDLNTLLPLIVMTHVHLVHFWLRDVGATPDLRRQTVALARAAARDHGEETTVTIAAYGTVHALIGSGMLDLAKAKLDSLVLPEVTPATAGMAGQLMLVHSLVAGFDRRPGDVAAPVAVAIDLAERFGENARTCDALGFAFGPARVGLYRMDLALEANEPELALGIARDMRPERHPWDSTRAVYWTHCGRAFARKRDCRDEAIRAFRQAETISPHHVHRDARVRETLSELLVRSHRDAIGRELRGLAYRAGLPV